jgi:signal transduction histidine kinase
LYLIRQERELAGKRLADSRRRAADQARAALDARLEQIKLREVRNWSSGRPAEALVLVLRGTQVQLPWESGQERGGEFGLLVEQGEQEEFARGRPDAAVETYQRALGLARNAAQSAYVRLALARALDRHGKSGEARRIFEELARTPPAVRDEFGVPFALYAADRLLQTGDRRTHYRAVLAEPAISPAGLYLLRRLAGSLGTPEERRLIDERIEWAERAEELKRIAPELPGSVWTAFGDPPWLATVDTALSGPEKLLIAVRADAGLSARETAGSLPLGEEFRTRERFLWAALALVLAVTFFAGFVSWTDMRREVASAKVRTEFVESVTHELRTPLASIRMFAETLRHRAPAAGPMQAECLDTIIGESERLTRLVDNVLDFSKIEQGRKIYRLAPVELARVVEAVVRTMRYPLERKRFALEVTVSPDLPAIAADADALEQAILNLLSNAVKYSGEAREIRLRVDRDGDDAVIRVQDKGVGIAPDQHRRIFERFYRAPTPASGETTGAGLGLTLVEHIARAHGGSVTVESAPGQGSTFSIRLPIGGPA